MQEHLDRNSRTRDYNRDKRVLLGILPFEGFASLMDNTSICILVDIDDTAHGGMSIKVLFRKE